MFTNDETLWITTEVRKQQENFLFNLQQGNVPAMINAATRLESILQAVMKVCTGTAELRRLVLPAEGPPSANVDFEAEAANSRGEPK